jgi:hypothetical protein
MEFNVRPLYIILAILVLIAIAVSPKLFETVEKGEYHVKQAFMSGEMTAKMTPGMYWQNFGSIQVFPVSETFFFTKDDEGGKGDAAVEVRFNDGSICHISGTCRVDLPRSEKDAIDLITVHGFRTYDQMEDKLILPVVRRSLIMTANFMSAKESYAEKRAEFFRLAWDQIEGGLYVTRDSEIGDTDPVTGQKITKVKKEIVVDAMGHPVREKNPMEGLGIHLSNFEIKSFVYEDRVQQQIKTQQEALMSVQTAKANSLKAEQDSITAEASGKAAVMKSKYEEEQVKVKAEVQAEKERQIATIAAQQKVDVATLEKAQALVNATKGKEVAAIDLEAAKLQKQQQIEIGTGEAERKRLVLAADNALAQKLDAYVAVQAKWAEAFSTRKVPTVVMAGREGGGTDSDAQTLMSLLTVQSAKSLALDMSIAPPTPTSAPAPAHTPATK